MRVLWLSAFFASCLANRGWGDQVTTVPYAGARITILEFANKPSTYYTLPLARLLQDSAKVGQNVLTGRNELSFDILMWNSEATETVRRYVNQANESSFEQRVEPLPLKQIRLIWNDSVRPLDSAFQVVNDWRAHTDQPACANFQINCQNLQRCNELMTAMETAPETFYALELQYLVSPLARREVTVTAEHLKRTDMYSKLARMSDVVHVSSDVIDELAAQTLAVTLSSLFSVDTPDRLALTNALKTVLKQDQVLTSFLPELWETVYWEPNVCRPDKAARQLSTVLRIDQNNAQIFILDGTSVPSSTCAFGLNISSLISNRTRAVHHSSDYNVPAETVMEAIRERQDMGWNGTHFHARPTTVYRVDLRALNGTKTLVRKMIPILGSGVPLSLKVRAQTGNYTSRVEEERLQTRLETELNKLVLLKSEIARSTEMKLAEAKMELSNNLTSLKSEMRAEMELANTKMVNTKVELANNLTTLKSETSTKMELANTKMAYNKRELANNLETLKSEMRAKMELANTKMVNTKVELANNLTTLKSEMSTKMELANTKMANNKLEFANNLKTLKSEMSTKMEQANTKMANLKLEFANNLTSVKSELITKIDLGDTNVGVAQKLALFNSVMHMSTKFEVDVVQAIAKAKTEQANMLTSFEARTNRELESMKRSLAREVGPANELVSRLTSVSRAFDNWPDYCRLPRYFCETYSAYNERRHATSIDACRRDCDANSRCVSFDFRSNYRIKCVLYHYICPFWYNDDHNPTTQYVKLSRVPLLTASMWKSLWTRGTLGNIPRDPCQLLGEHNYMRD